jgi:hypothetical protein
MATAVVVTVPATAGSIVVRIESRQPAAHDPAVDATRADCISAITIATELLAIDETAHGDSYPFDDEPAPVPW